MGRVEETSRDENQDMFPCRITRQYSKLILLLCGRSSQIKRIVPLQLCV